MSPQRLVPVTVLAWDVCGEGLLHVPLREVQQGEEVEMENSTLLFLCCLNVLLCIAFVIVKEGQTIYIDKDSVNGIITVYTLVTGSSVAVPVRSFLVLCKL